MKSHSTYYRKSKVILRLLVRRVVLRTTNELPLHKQLMHLMHIAHFDAIVIPKAFGVMMHHHQILLPMNLKMLLLHKMCTPHKRVIQAWPSCHSAFFLQKIFSTTIGGPFRKNSRQRRGEEGLCNFFSAYCHYYFIAWQYRPPFSLLCFLSLMRERSGVQYWQLHFMALKHRRVGRRLYHEGYSIL